MKSETTSRCTRCGDTRTVRYGGPCPECATDPEEEAKNTLWMATRLREQGCEILELKSEVAELRLCLRQIRDCTSLNSKVGQWARSGLSVFDLSKRYTMRSESDVR